MQKLRVFISHVYEERHAALVLQKYIRQAFGVQVEVFASSDNESIGGGKKWFTHITESLKGSAIVLVLISSASRRRQWINFEAGFGDGAGADVIPVSIRGFSLAKLDYPLAGYQGRSVDDLPSILADITRVMDRASQKQDLGEYLAELRSAEAKMAYRSLTLRPFVSSTNRGLTFEIENIGNSDVELLILEATLPIEFLYDSWATVAPESIASAHMHVERRWGREYERRWFACTSNRGAFGSKSGGLRPILTPSMGPTVVTGMSIPLSRSMDREQESDRPIEYQIHAVDYPTETERTTWKELWKDFR